MPPIVVAGAVVVVVGAAAAWLLGKYLSTPTPSPIGPGGIAHLPPIAAATNIPPGSKVAIKPDPFPATVGAAGVLVSIAVNAQVGVPIGGIPIRVRIEPGSDAGVTSLIRGVVTPAGPAWIGSGVDGATDPANAIGDLNFTLSATVDGDEDLMTIIVNPGGTVPGLQEKRIEYRYATTNP